LNEGGLGLEGFSCFGLFFRAKGRMFNVQCSRKESLRYEPSFAEAMRVRKKHRELFMGFWW
jgi:hypothetical protein